MRSIVVTVLAAAVLAPAAGGAQSSGFAFGRTGGNIRPFTVFIATDGTVRVSGAAQVARAKLTSLQIGNLNRVATDTRFTSLPAMTNCPGSLPDVARTFIRVGALRVQVHGECVPRYARLWNALARAVKLS